MAQDSPIPTASGSSIPFLDAIRRYRPIWKRWCEYASGTLNSDIRAPDPELLARAIRTFLTEIEGALWPDRLDSRIRLVTKEFGFTELPSDDLRRGHGKLSVRLDAQSGELTGLHYSVKRVGGARDASVVLHELGHVFFAVASELIHQRNGGVHADPFEESERVEQFCWRFSSEFALPREEFQKITTEAFNRMRKEHGCQDSPMRLDFFGLRALASHFRVSLRLLISALDRSRLIDELGAGVAVIVNTPNRYTKRSADLRIVFCARPSWGHVIFNQRAVRLGFADAYSALELGVHMTPRVVSEHLNLKRRCPDCRPTWQADQFSTVCEYTPIDVRDEGRYLIASWNWDRR